MDKEWRGDENDGGGAVCGDDDDDEDDDDDVDEVLKVMENMKINGKNAFVDAADADAAHDSDSDPVDDELPHCPLPRAAASSSKIMHALDLCRRCFLPPAFKHCKPRNKLNTSRRLQHHRSRQQRQNCRLQVRLPRHTSVV
jgi:hypothetical protein